MLIVIQYTLSFRVQLRGTTDCRLPDFSLHGILQARTLEWVAIPFSTGSDPGIKPWTPVLQADSLPFEPPGKSQEHP